MSDLVGTLKDTALASLTVTLTAGEERVINQTGEFIKCISTSATVKLGLGEGEPRFDFGQGAKVRTKNNERFTGFKLKNNNAGTVTLNLVVGYGDIEVDQIALKEFATRAVHSGAITVANNTWEELTVPSFTNSDKQKSVLIYNSATGGVVYVGDGTTKGIAIPFGQTFQIDTSDTIHVRNESGSPVDIYATQIVYYSLDN